MSNTGRIEPPSDTKIFGVNTDYHIGSRMGLLVNPKQYTRNGRGRGNRGRCRNNKRYLFGNRCQNKMNRNEYVIQIKGSEVSKLLKWNELELTNT